MFEMNHTVVFLTLIILAKSQDLSNLGREISETVDRNLAPLQNLGARITSRVNAEVGRINNANYDMGRQIQQNVQQSLAPLDNLGAQIEQSVYTSLEPVRALEVVNNMKNGIGGVTIVKYLPGDLSNLGREISETVNRNLAPLQNLGARITSRVNAEVARINNANYDMGRQIQQNVQQSLAPLDNLGAQIEQSVYTSLEPVRALEVVNNMKNGIGGVTIVKYLPGGNQFIIRNGQVSKCEGEVDQNTGECSGTLTPFRINDQQDYCFLTSGYSIVNNKICLGADSVSIINSEITCRSHSGRPTLLTDLDSFRKMCKNLATTVLYRYIADANDPVHVPIPNSNRYVKCDNNTPGVCEFTYNINFPGYGRGISVNNNNFMYIHNRK